MRAEVARDGEDRLREWGLRRRTLPFNWKRDKRMEGITGLACYAKLGGLAVILTAMVEKDGKRWLHLSVSARERIPNWKELKEVKELFIGKEKLAIQVLPPDSEFVNIHPNVLHLWHCLDEDPVPDFRNEWGGI